MALYNPEQRGFLDAVNAVAAANPFLPELAEAEQAALGAEYQDQGAIWSLSVEDPQKLRSNAWRICERLERELPELRRQLIARKAFVRDDEIALLEGAVVYMLYHRHYPTMAAESFTRDSGNKPAHWTFFRSFEEQWAEWLHPPGLRPLTDFTASHMFAFFFQLVRAFHWIFENIIGQSAPAARLRAAVWQSIFTHDIRRYRRSLYARMGDLVTFVTGPSGTGKELVARAIAFSRYVPFDARRLAFEDDPAQHFHPINIAALSSTLVESELFGHRRGSFTGANQDRKGWLEACPPLGAVFLDEIGELSPEIQVKLLRVIETRTFYSVGDTSSKRFVGKLIAATNREMAEEIRAGRFREDLYYRLCSDLIVTPSLRQQLDESPAVLRDLVLFLARRVAGPESDSLAVETIEFIESHMPANYAWPGNYRELEQCIRNVLVRKSYQPARTISAGPSDIFAGAHAGAISAEDLLRRYITLVYARTGTYEGAASVLGLDRRTVKAKVDEQLLEQLRSSPSSP